MKDEKRGWRPLDRFYKYGYEVLQEISQQNISIEGLFVSDSGILFVRNRNNRIDCLKALLRVIKELNKKMLNDDFMLTTSIAYGEFKYQERIEFRGIEKNSIYGNAYMSAFWDNENGKPNIQPGQCRIVKKNLPEDLIQVTENNNDDETLRMIKKRNNDENHYYFYWMREEPHEISEFEKEYNDTYNLKYAGILKALKKR